MVDVPDRRGIYNIDYFSGSQVAIYIGDVLVDEITSMNFAVHQSRAPIYGYADKYFRDVSEGNVLVQGTFTINFKEAGYLWLILNRYRAVMKGKATYLSEIGKPDAGLSARSRSLYDGDQDYVNSQTIEQMTNGELSSFRRNDILRRISSGLPVTDKQLAHARTNTQKDLLGFSSRNRAGLRGNSIGAAENIFEAFEDKVWSHETDHNIEQHHRRADDPELNNFDIFVTFGDYTGSDHENHTVEKITNVMIVGSSKEIVIDGQPTQEAYQFIGRNLI